MAQNSNPFTPESTVSQAVTGTTATKAIGAGSGQIALVQNDSTATAFFKFGDANITAATTADTPILAGQSQVFSMPTNTVNVAVIGTSGTLYVTRGRGQ